MELPENCQKAPRVTPEDIENAIYLEYYFRAIDGVLGSELGKPEHHPSESVTSTALSLLTFCVLVLKNGYTVTGESACVSPANFDANVGRRIARENAISKLWPLMGYALKERMESGVTMQNASDGVWAHFGFPGGKCHYSVNLSLTEMSRPFAVEYAQRTDRPSNEPANRISYQQRVIEEKRELDERLVRLLRFFQTTTFAGLPEAERSRLRNQARFMDGYAAVLEERIAAFGSPT